MCAWLLIPYILYRKAKVKFLLSHAVRLWKQNELFLSQDQLNGRKAVLIDSEDKIDLACQATS